MGTPQNGIGTPQLPGLSEDQQKQIMQAAQMLVLAPLAPLIALTNALGQANANGQTPGMSL